MTAAPRAFASFLAAALVLVPLPGHWRARNIPTLALIAWLFALNIAHGVNVIEWSDNTDIKLKIWCDIYSKLVIGANMAIPASCFCLALRLEGIAAVRNVKTSHFDKRRRMLADIAICTALPAVQMAFHYIVQGHRFDIVERFGCQPETYVSLPEFFLIWFIPILLCLTTFVLGGLSFFHFWKRRATFARHLSATNTGLTPSRYFRLMSMSLALMIWNLAVFIVTLMFNYRRGLRPWTNWDDVHSDWLHINQFPVVFIPIATLRWTYFIWWVIPATAYLFFAFFAFGHDAILEYQGHLAWFKRHVLRLRPSTTAKGRKGLCINDSSFAPVGSYSSPVPPRMAAYAHSRDTGPSSPSTAKDASRLSLADSQCGGRTFDASSVSFYGHASDEKGCDFAVTTNRCTTDEALPPYHPPGFAQLPSTPSTPVITSPSPALVADGDNLSIISHHAHSDRIV